MKADDRVFMTDEKIINYESLGFMFLYRSAKISKLSRFSKLILACIGHEDESYDGAPIGNQNAAGPHKGAGHKGGRLSKEEKAQITKRLVGKESSQGTVVSRISSHAFDRIGERRISMGRIENMLASTDVSEAHDAPDRKCYDFPGSRLVLSNEGVIITVMWRK